MKSVLCKSHGSPDGLVLEECQSPVAGTGEVVVSVHAAGLNFPDTLIVEGKYQTKPPLPFSPGSEFSGIVKEVGGGVEHIKVGDQVVGIVPFGAFSEECVVSAKRVVPKPAGMDFKTAAAFLLTYGTSYHALCNRIRTAPGETLLVLGAAGGVGLAAVEIGKVLGMRVIACASNNQKLTVCREHGADECINYQEEDLRARLKDLTNGKGADVVYDAVGGAMTETALRSLAWRGRLLIVGFASGSIPQIPMNLPLLMEREIVGVHWGAWIDREYKEFVTGAEELGIWYAQGKIRPHISARYSMADVSLAMRDLLGRQVSGKLVIDLVA
ncbi:NADPH:quinone oxidoreductase family protein [Herbaspirillum robiniae]|uniref:NADPH:quinone oxidoreductase family protein n=1 Tax=Herbaspirillum robiniae TaxID=2014887 RepID=UPI003D76FF7B